MKRVFFFLTIISIFSAYSSAQSQFIAQGDEGFLLMASMATGDNGNSWGGGLGYSISGRVDIGFAAAHVYGGTGGVQTTAKEAFTTFFLSKGKTDAAFNISYIHAGKAKGLGVGYFLGKNFKLTDNFQIEPGFSYHLSTNPSSSAYAFGVDFFVIKHLIISSNIGFAEKAIFGGLGIGVLVGG